MVSASLRTCSAIVAVMVVLLAVSESPGPDGSLDEMSAANRPGLTLRGRPFLTTRAGRAADRREQLSESRTHGLHTAEGGGDLLEDRLGASGELAIHAVASMSATVG